MSEDTITEAAVVAAALPRRARAMAGEHICANCATRYTGAYCPACGQAAAALQRPLLGILSDALSDYFAVDARWMRTFRALALRPGRLASDYADGQRVRYTPPTRAFIFSILTVFVANWAAAGVDRLFGGGLPEPVSVEAQISQTFGRADASLVRIRAREGEGAEDTIVRARQALSDAKTSALDQDPDEPLVDRITFDDSGLDSVPAWLQPHIQAAAAGVAGAMAEPDRFLDRFLPWVPRVVAFMAFVFAVLSAIFYWGRYVAEHTVFSLYLHAGLAFAVSIAVIVGAIPVIGWAAILIYLAMPIYIGKALRAFHHSGRFTTVLRMLPLAALYLVTFTMLLAGAALRELTILGQA